VKKGIIGGVWDLFHIFFCLEAVGIIRILGILERERDGGEGGGGGGRRRMRIIWSGSGKKKKERNYRNYMKKRRGGGNYGKKGRKEL
jgi:hypothetical protein